MSTQSYQNQRNKRNRSIAEVLDQFEEPRRNTRQFTGDTRRHTDARSIRELFGIPAWDRSRFGYETVIPNCFEHTWDPPLDEDYGGTDFLCVGKPGKGKSTFANYVAARVIEINDEKVVWRGSASRSEWLPLAPWTRLCLPADVEVSARLESKDPKDPSIDIDVDDLEHIVREVVRYENPVQLNRELLEPGMVHVVYPDPRMRGCQEVYEQSPERTYESPKDRGLFEPEDPASHWWFAWMLARVEHGPHHWTSVFFDEIGDIMPQSAKKDRFGTYQKVQLAKDTWVDARKFGLSIFAFGHSETDIHQMIRRKIRWRVQMRGTANPTSPNDVVGFESIPMNGDITSRLEVGKALMYTETNFEKFAWKDMSDGTPYKLRLEYRGLH